MLVQRLGFGPGVREALRFTFERWNGNGYPDARAGRGDPARDARRAPQPRHGGDRPPVLARARHRGRARPPRPHVRPGARRPVRRARRAAGSTGSPRWSRGTPCSRSSPSRAACSTATSSTTRSTVAADFIDLKSPYMGGHSRRCAQLAADAARRARARTRTPSTALRRAALVHDFGTTAVPNSIWDKPGPLTRTEFDRVELHPMLTEQMLRRSPALAALNPVASAHHEKCDGSGYHKRVRADADDLGACVLAATEVYVGLTTERADRPPFSAEDAAAELRRLESEGVLEPRATPGGARGRGPRRAAARPRQAAAATRAGSRAARSRCCALAARGAHDARDRRPALHLAEDRRPPHPAHLRQDRGLDAAPPPRCGRCSTTSSLPPDLPARPARARPPVSARLRCSR